MLNMEGLTKRFGAVTAVDEVSVSIPVGQMVGIIGCSGAGKSTLLRLINRLVPPSSGKISFNGTELTGLKGNGLRKWRAECAMIFQQFHLVERLDVLTNVLIGRINHHRNLPSMFKLFKDTERTLAIEALDRLDMAPQALQRAETLSGGQQQRVAIARALMQEPKIVLADEPIASLDPHNAAKVMDALKSINKEDGKTVIANLHTLDTARTYADRIIGMAEGKIVFDGPPKELTDQKVLDIYGVEGSEELNQCITSTALPESGGQTQESDLAQIA
jgi:phosphonate transport system ATP-binding protein